MKTEELIRMANQIGRFFESYPEAEALEGIGGHLRRFWEPRMREQLLAHAEAGGEGLTPLAARACAKLFAAGSCT